MARLGVALLALFALFVFTSAQDDLGRCLYCEGLDCGPDGVGGSCGNCPTGQRCSRGLCICDRGCTGFECGPDRCGTTCGECLPGQTCISGLCTGACTPQCVRDDGSIRTCGWDRCGGCCGRCPEGFRCRDGTCECYPNCENKHCGPDGCGGVCGTCAGDAICQDNNDRFPQQCYVNCQIDITVEVRELVTNRLVEDACSVSVTGPLGYSSPNSQYPGSNPGFFVLDVSTGKFGDYSFTTTCTGYQVDFEVHSVTFNGQMVTILVEWNQVLIEVRDDATLELLPSASISITGSGFNQQVSWFSPSFLWAHGGFMMYTFTTSSTGYDTRTVQEPVTVDTTMITLFLGKGSIRIVVEECPTGIRLSTATVSVSNGATVAVTGGAGAFVATNGFTTYTFTTSSPPYIQNTQNMLVTESTTEIVLCVNLPPVEVIVTDCATGDLLNGANVAISNTFYSFSTTVVHSAGSTFFTPVGYEAGYQFDATFTGYGAASSFQNIQVSTTEVRICMTQDERCGNGFCAGDETADPLSPNRCEDCGRLRGVISLAVGQKDQLVNITVNIWAHPTNPALFMRRGEAVPAPHYSLKSDSKGFFGIRKLTFLDAPGTNVVPGGLTRRFYFSLSGRYTDRTSGNDVVVTLLPLWWNYELVNSQWFGSGSLIGTNNSPSLYFYMTPPFSTDDAIIRVILSWGTLISNPSSSLPDLDMVVAGPIDNNSVNVFGNGIVNFENKDLHSSTDNVLPFAKIITDSAQGFGPEVVDFQGNPGDDEIFNLGWSDTYAAGADAQAYEIWIDRPNSAPNGDSAFTFIFDTNSFIVIYQSDGFVNEQLLFDDLTGIEWTYGWYNGDQWNRVPETATMWHIIDFSRTVGRIVYEGFPEGTQGGAEPAGAKYAFNSGFFEETKQIPCGHTAARGANPAYCPATLTYPQKKK